MNPIPRVLSDGIQIPYFSSYDQLPQSLTCADVWSLQEIEYAKVRCIKNPHLSKFDRVVRQYHAGEKYGLQYHKS